MEKTGYIILAVVSVVFLILMLAGFINSLPYGILGLLLIIGLGILLIKVISVRLSSKEDDYYSKKVEK